MAARLTAEELALQGFTPEQIERLATLRAAYPLIEWVTSEQLQRLRFLKWRHQRQLLPA